MPEPIWKPSAERIAQANLTAFIEWVRAAHPTIVDYRSLYDWSIACPEYFWPAVWEFCDVRASRKWDEVIGKSDNPNAPALARKWFVGARLNFAENLLRFRDERETVVFWNEQGRQRSLSFGELYVQVARTAAALREMGIGIGDRVAAFMPNLPEAVIGMLATTSLGAIWSSTSPDFGLQGVLDRFGQIEPRVLFAADGYWYNGKRHDSLPRIAEITARIPSIERTVIVRYANPRSSFAGIANSIPFNEFTGTASEQEIQFAQLPFDHPIYILYSSGTTGVPKCIVHGAGGTLLQHLKEQVLHTDLRREDRMIYFTTCGWMMWNWLVSGLAVGSTIILFDGSPFCPDANRLWELAERERVTVFGTSAKYLAAIEKAGVEPAQDRDLSALRTILSTGSVLANESFDYVYEKVKSDVCLSSISGGTDIVSCFALGNPIAPVYRGQLQTRGLGMNVQVFNDAGNAVCGEKGELVCIAPFPSMPVSFWNDPDGQDYRAAYFDEFPGAWRHGDWVELTEEGGMIFYGRSDTVLNPGGVRIGTAEIYRQVEKLDDILESVVVGQEWESDVRIVLFVKLRPGLTLDDLLREKIKQQIRANATPRHVPQKIIQVADVPRTISGKIVELAVRNVIHGLPVKNRDALANPESLKFFENLPELRTA